MEYEIGSPEWKDALMDEMMKRSQERMESQKHEAETASLKAELEALKEENRRIADQLSQKQNPEKTFEEALASIVGG